MHFVLYAILYLVFASKSLLHDLGVSVVGVLYVAGGGLHTVQ